MDEPSSEESAVQIWPPAPQREPPPVELRQPWRKRLFAVPLGPASVREVIAWWQARRLIYNLLVFGLGIPSFFLYLFFLLTSGQLAPGEDAVEPLELLFAPIIVPIGVNICYTFGVIAELIWRKLSKDTTRRFGRLLMQAGVCFSLFIVFFPSVTWGVIWFDCVILRHGH